MRSLLFLCADCILLMYVSEQFPGSHVVHFFSRCSRIDTLHLGCSMAGWMSREQSVGQVTALVNLHAKFSLLSLHCWSKSIVLRINWLVCIQKMMFLLLSIRAWNHLDILHSQDFESKKGKSGMKLWRQSFTAWRALSTHEESPSSGAVRTL